MKRRGIHVWVRTNIDWSQMNEASLFAHNRSKFYHDDYDVAKKIEEGMGVFKSVIGSDFFEMRSLVSGIARQNLRDMVENGTVDSILYDPCEIGGLPDDDLVISTDDDDLIHPQIGSKLVSCGGNAIILWRHLICRDFLIRPWKIREEVKNKDLKLQIQPIRTNNSAITVRLMREMIAKGIHTRHGKIGKELLHNRGLDYKYIDEPFSVVVRNPFTATSLINHKKAFREKRFRAIVARADNHDDDFRAMCNKHGIRWALPCLEKVGDVYRKLEIRSLRVET